MGWVAGLLDSPYLDRVSSVGLGRLPLVGLELWEEL